MKTETQPALAASDGSAACYECGGSHEPSGARSDCIRHWKLRAIEAENKLLVQQVYGEALRRIRSYPVHSEPVGGAYAMKDIAHDALTTPNDDNPLPINESVLHL